MGTFVKPQVQALLNPCGLFHGSFFGQDTSQPSEPQPSTDETQEIHKYVSCCLDMTETMLNSLPNDKILDWSKFKALADDKINLNQKLKFDMRRVKIQALKTGVVFVKGAFERNEFFEKKKLTVIYKEQVRMTKAKD